MKVAVVLIICLAVAVHQTTANPSLFDQIGEGIRHAGSIAKGVADKAGSAASNAAHTAGSIASGVAKGVSGAAQGAIGVATGIKGGIIRAGTGILGGLADKAASVQKSISEQVNKVENHVLKGALHKAQEVLTNVQENARGSLHASEASAKKLEDSILDLETKKNDVILQWSEKAKQKAVDASQETQDKVSDLVDHFAQTRSEAVMRAADKVVRTLENLQERANATAQHYHEPMNNLIAQVGKCSEIDAHNVKALIKCAGEVQKAVVPLLSASRDLASIKVQLNKASVQNVLTNIHVRKAIGEFQNESLHVEALIDHMVAEDKKKAAEQKSDEKPADDQSADDQPADDQSADDQPADDQSADEEEQ